MTIFSAPFRPILALAMAAAIGLTACSVGAAPSTLPSVDPTPSPRPSSPPADSVDPGGGGSAGNPGSGVGSGPIDPRPVDPGTGQATLVTPIAGRANPHPVSPVALQASVDGRHVLVKVSWYGGVAPCSVLDSVAVERFGSEIAITPLEGSSDLNAMCIELAMLKATIVDLGELEPGTYRISSPRSTAPPVAITID